MVKFFYPGGDAMLAKYANQILNIFNYVDSALITDKEGIIRYYHLVRPDINSMKPEKMLGKSIFDIYKGLTKENSIVWSVLKTGKPQLNVPQRFTTYNNETIDGIISALPLIEKGKLIGAVEVASYQKEKIVISTSRLEKKTNLYELDDIIGRSEKMLQLKEKIIKISNTESNVLVYGETGTGKELVAQSLHREGKRKSEKFISQNCAAIPATLLESILFGTVKGSFTGAENRKGLFEVSDGGTLFLDEINSMDLNIQAKLLKAIEEKKITRVGGEGPIDVDVRIISATNKAPFQCVEDGALREDLFYRLGSVQLRIPPLRERREDIKELTDYFIRDYNLKMGCEILGVASEVDELFQTYHWPGNVRELRSIIESGFNLATGNFIMKEDLPDYIWNRVEHNTIMYPLEKGKSLKEILDGIEKDILIDAIAASNSYAQAARKLRLSKQSFYYKLKRYGINAERTE
ncbi:MAG: AAA family ATPase [Clostridia bacterium]|nr:AAA family ATPase [Clostridia bacterium]